MTDRSEPVLKQPWRVSLHGGHSGEFCDHAQGTLREVLEAAVAAGYETFGVSEHCPRYEERFLYAEERVMGWDVDKILADFERYTVTIQELAAEFADRLTVLRGFEAEVISSADYVRQMKELRDRKLPDGRPVFDFFLGSVHFVGEIQIDGPPENYIKAVEAYGGPEPLAIAYYNTITEMIEALHPPVVGHLDLIKRNFLAAGYTGPEILETARVKRAIETTLEAVKATGAILDLNTAGWRKGLGEPYPAPWLVRMATERGIPFCFGDDSHRPSDVGAGVDAARGYLLENGVQSITILSRSGPQIGDPIVQKVVPLA